MRFVYLGPRAQLRPLALLALAGLTASLLVPALFVYVMANFFLAVRHLPAKGEEGSEYVVRVGSAIAAEKSVYEVRLFSGHWLLFYLLPALFFLYVPPGAHPRDESAAEVELSGRQAAG